jgi:hypothetical protein
VRKVITRLLRGESLETICENSNRVNLSEHPGSWIWLERAFVLRPSEARDYRAVQLNEQLFNSERVPFELSNELREQSVEYLSRSAWGTVLLNSGEALVWATALPLVPRRPSRRGHVAVLRGTLRHWPALTALGSRFYSGGGSSHTFPQALPEYGGVLAQYGLDVRDKGNEPAWRPIHELCDDAFIERIATDDHHWATMVREWSRKAGTPELVPENIAEIVSLCEQGSWNKEQWAFVERQSGPEAVERALSTLEASGAREKLLGVLIHALGDMQRATDLYSAHIATTPSLGWATTRIAEFLAHTKPERAAQLFANEADQQAQSGKKSSYREAVVALRAARDTLIRVDLDPLWKSLLTQFREVHGRRKQLIAELDSAFPGEW